MNTGTEIIEASEIFIAMAAAGHHSEIWCKLSGQWRMLDRVTHFDLYLSQSVETLPTLSISFFRDVPAGPFIDVEHKVLTRTIAETLTVDGPPVDLNGRLGMHFLMGEGFEDG